MEISVQQYILKLPVQQYIYILGLPVQQYILELPVQQYIYWNSLYNSIFIGAPCTTVHILELFVQYLLELPVQQYIY